MNEQAIKDSYELFKTGGYTKSYEEFVSLINSNPQALEDSYELFKSGGYSKSMQDYEALMGVKKKDEPTESTSESGSLDLFEAPKPTEDVSVEVEVMEPSSTRTQPIQVTPDSPTQGGISKENRELQEVNQAEMDKALVEQDLVREQEKSAQLDTARAIELGKESTKAMLAQVNEELISLEEEEVVPKLRSLFKGRGFTFEETGIGDKVRVRTTDGMHSLDISLDNFLNSSDVAESAELQTFLRTHINPEIAAPNEDQISKALRAQEMRDSERWNDDGTASTVKFMSYEEDGVYKVAPTLFPRSTVQKSSPRQGDWLELEGDEAIREAERRGEVFNFTSEEEAEAFAKGSWKTTNVVDIEAQKFYNGYGRDYLSDRNAYDNYMNARDARIFLEEQIEISEDNRWGGVGQYQDLSPQEQEQYAEYFREDGSLRGDAAEIAEKLDDEAAELWKIVDGNDFRVAQEDLDVFLEKRHKASAQTAANMNYEARAIEQGLSNQALNEFGITLDQLTTYEPKSAAERLRLDEMIKAENSVRATKTAAALKYETALTYYDTKANKDIGVEFTDNLEGWATATADGYKNGKAAQELLYLAMGIYGEDEVDQQLAAERMTEWMNSVDGRQSRAMSRFNSAEDGFNREVRSALARDPFEVMLTWAASSLSQIVPYGAKIIPSFVGVGAGIGAAYGAAGFNPVTVAAGAGTGATWGLRTGFAATNLVLEYTNGVLDAGREQGYNMNDPQDAARAFSDSEVWERGRERGLKRGIPIAVMDIFMGGLAGRIFKPVAVASKARKVAAFAAERAIVDPTAEATGELLAQLNVGDEISIKEIMAEFGGAVGNQSSNAAVNIYRSTRGGYNQRIAQNMMDVRLMAADGATDSQIQTWTNNMKKLGKITPEQSQKILENVGLRREANELLGVTAPSRIGIGKKKRARVMELLDVRAGLESSTNTREIFSTEIKAINEELAAISRTNNLVESPVNLDNINRRDGLGRRTVPSYRIGNTLYSKNDFLSYIENLSPRRANKILKDSQVINDEETSLLVEEKLKPFVSQETTETTEDAIQERSTETVDVQEQTTDGEAVGERNPVGEVTEEVEVEDQVGETTSAETSEEVLDQDTQEAVDLEAADLEQSLGLEPVAEQPVAEQPVAEEDEETLVFRSNKAEREVQEVKNDFKKQRAKIKRRKASDAKDAALAALDAEESTAIEEIRKDSRIVRAALAVKRGKGLPKFAQKGGKFEATAEQLQQIASLAGVEVETITESESSNSRPEFRLKGESLELPQNETDAETVAVLEAMNEVGAQMEAEQNQELSDIDSRLKLNKNDAGKTLTVAQRKTLTQRADELRQRGRARDTESTATPIDVDELNSRLDNPLPTIEWKVVEGVPMIFNISDQLRTGDITNPATGNTIDNLKGGLGFTGVEGHQDMAWASVTRDKAQGQIDNATKVYNDNKEYFTRWWKANPEYNGLVPMSIVKMGQSSILSNEAVVRVLGDNISALPIARRKKAVTAFKRAVKESIKIKQDAIKSGVKELTQKQYAAYIKDAQDVLAMVDVVKPTTIEQILTPEALSNLKGITSVNVITDLVMSGQPNEVGEKKRKPSYSFKTAKAVIKVLLGENPTEEQKKLLNAGVITDLITEPQLEGVPQRSVFMVQGVDVLNPDILETNHPNYPVGPRGRTIGVLEQPQSVVDLFPAVANNVQLGIAQEQQGRPSRSERSRLTQVIPVQAGMPNTEFVGAIAGVENTVSVLDFLNRSFPSVTLSTDTETFSNVMASEGVREYLKGDEVVYGVTKDGDIYLNPDVHSSESALYNTAVHEFGHVWTDYLQTTKKGREIYSKGASLVTQTAEYQNQLKKFKSEGLTEEEAKKRAVNETMAILIGNKGETIINASLKQKFQAWLNATWTYIKDTFKMSKDLSPEEIQNLTLDEFLGTALADIMSGKPLKLTESQSKKLKNPEAAFSRSDSMADIIARGRAEGFSEASIRQVLRSRGQKVADINAAMLMSMDLFSDAVVPFEFGNIEGGMDAGIQLFQQVQSELAAFAQPTVTRTSQRMSAAERRARLAELRENNPTLLELSDAALLRRFPRRGVAVETTTTEKTPGEIRQKALEILRANPTYQEQTEARQMELAVALDRAIGIGANRNVSKEIRAIRGTLTQRKRAVREVQSVKRQLRQLIRKSLPKSDGYSQADINKIVRSVERVNEDNFRVEVEKVLQVVEKQRAKLRKKTLKKLMADVTRGAKKTTTDTKKSRAGSLSAQGQSFAAQFKRALKLAMASDAKQEEAMEKFMQLAEELQTDEAIVALAKSASGEVLTSKEESIVNLAVALDLVKNLPNMTLEEVQALANDYAVAASRSRQELSESRKKRALENDALRTKVTDAMRRSNPELFDADGNIIGQNRRRAMLDDVRRYWNEGKGQGLSARMKGQAKAAKLYVETYKWRSAFQAVKSLMDGLKHLGTFMNSMNETLYDEVFNRLNRMDNNALKGRFNQTKILNDLGFEEVQQTLFDNKTLTIEGVRESKTGKTYTDSFSKDQLLRIYALSLNPVQRKKLEEQGFTTDKMNEIKSFLGKDATDFADKVVNYLSNEYYESVNDVYREVNDINLNYVENYFPTITTQAEVNPKQLFEGDFNGIFNAESAPALRNREDMKSDIALKAANFTSALTSHMETMERYKAYADGAKKLNVIFSTDAVDTALTMLGTKSMVKQSVNNAVNPDSAKTALNQSGKLFNILQTQFTSFALAFRAVQIGKQATSFINAFENYSFRKSGKQNTLVDLLPFLYDYASVIARSRSYHNLAMEMSPTYRYRVEQGIAADLSGLEAGSPTRTGFEQRQTTDAKLFRKFKTAAASPTILGDLMGVAGYMANYRRNIRNGMSEEKAAEAFNEFNQTQQSRRATEKSIIQQNSNYIVRAFTMFGSTPILYINNVMQALNNIISPKKKTTTQDVRKLVLNLGAANAAFVAMSNLGILLRGDDEEKKEVLRQIRNAMLGLNLLYQVPFMGTVAKSAENWITGKRRPTDIGVNPFVSLFRKMKKAAEDDKAVSGALKTVVEIGVGAQLDPFITLLEQARDMDEVEMREVYDIIGYSESYRPEVDKEGYRELTPRAKKEQEKKERIKEKQESNPAFMRRKEKEKEARKKRRDLEKFGRD